MEVMCYQSGSCRNGSDLTYSGRRHWLLHRGIFPVTGNFKISRLGDSPVCLQKYHSRSSSSFTLLLQSTL